MSASQQKLNEALSKLNSAISRKRNLSTCLKLWSKFIRLRDNGKCVGCGSDEKISAHHIMRKCFLPETQLMTGNGISLCFGCHKYVHEQFNRKPDLRLPMDAQNGEKIELISEQFRVLYKSAKNKSFHNEKHYFISDQVLSKFKQIQGYDPSEPFPGSRIEQAYYIWNCSPLSVRNAVLEANGITGRHDPFLPIITVQFEQNPNNKINRTEDTSAT